MSDLNNNQQKIKKKRGGSRPGAGRPLGSSNKVKTSELVQDFYQRSGMSWAEFVHTYMLELKLAGQHELATKLLVAMNKYHLEEDAQTLDVTTAGQAIIPTLVFQPARLPDWSNDPKD